MEGQATINHLSTVLNYLSQVLAKGLIGAGISSGLRRVWSSTKKPIQAFFSLNHYSLGALLARTSGILFQTI
jgi:hypothetical protein